MTSLLMWPMSPLGAKYLWKFIPLIAADDEFQTLCFAFGLELDEVVRAV